MMARRYTMSESARLARVKGGQARAAQRTSEDQRRARAALAAQVDPAYWTIQARRGGRRYRQLHFLELAQYYDIRQDEEMQWLLELWHEKGHPPAIIERLIEKWNEARRAHYLERAAEYDDPARGCRLMMIVFSPETEFGE